MSEHPPLLCGGENVESPIQLVPKPIHHVVARLNGGLSPNLGALGLMAGSLLALPVSWPHYLLAIVPVFVLGARELSPRSVTSTTVLFGALLLVPLTPVVLHTVGLLFIWTSIAIRAFVSRQSLLPPWVKDDGLTPDGAGETRDLPFVRSLDFEISQNRSSGRDVVLGCSNCRRTSAPDLPE